MGDRRTTIFISNIHPGRLKHKDQLVLLRDVDLAQSYICKSHRAEIYDQTLVSLRRSGQESKEILNDHLHQQCAPVKAETRRPTSASPGSKSLTRLCTYVTTCRDLQLSLTYFQKVGARILGSCSTSSLGARSVTSHAPHRALKWGHL